MTREELLNIIETDHVQCGEAAALARMALAFYDWHDKTAWVQTDKRFDVLTPWGKHRADVLKEYIEHLESRTVKLPDELSGETLLDVASSTDLVYSDDTGVLEYTNINGCFVKVTAPPDKVIRFRCSSKRIYMRLVDRVKTHENTGIIIDFHKNNKDFIQ